MASKPTRGGKRENAGRKSELKKPVLKGIRLEQEVVDKIEELGYSVSQFYREAGDRYLRYILRKSKKS